MTFDDRFTTRAGAYAASRPAYPLAAIDALFTGLAEPAGLVVADLGAGTGISSRLLADRGSRVLAIEPSAAMREASGSDSRITWIDATAEHTTLASGSVDVVVAFQAWHWFDRELATAEALRVLCPGGRLAMVYNEREESDPFTAAYGAIVRRFAMDATEQRRADALESALTIEATRTARQDFGHVQALDRTGLHARATSSSYLPQTGATAAAMHADIDALYDRFAVGGVVKMQLVTIVVRNDL